MVDASNQLDPNIKAGHVVHKKKLIDNWHPISAGKGCPKLTGVEDTGICAGTTKDISFVGTKIWPVPMEDTGNSAGTAKDISAPILDSAPILRHLDWQPSYGRKSKTNMNLVKHKCKLSNETN